MMANSNPPRGCTLEEGEVKPNARMLNPNEWADIYGDQLLRYALIYVRCREIAEDLVQDTFLAALRSRDNFVGKSSEKTWLIAILKHKIIDYHRKSRRHMQLEEFNDAIVIEDGQPNGGRCIGYVRTESKSKDWRFDPALSAERRAFRTMLDKCLSQLPPRMAAAFQLREIEQLSTKEICELLDVSEKNLWVMFHRARLSLRRCIESNWLNLVN
jgi:RNA polymerase sigma-70 factor (TIGR02943 family)